MKKFLIDDGGLTSVEIVLIIVVLIGLVIILKSQLIKLISDIFDRISSDSSSL